MPFLGVPCIGLCEKVIQIAVSISTGLYRISLLRKVRWHDMNLRVDVFMLSSHPSDVCLLLSVGRALAANKAGQTTHHF